jgi:hypothetical protein
MVVLAVLVEDMMMMRTIYRDSGGRSGFGMSLTEKFQRMRKWVGCVNISTWSEQ